MKTFCILLSLLLLPCLNLSAQTTDPYSIIRNLSQQQQKVLLEALAAKNVAEEDRVRAQDEMTNAKVELGVANQNIVKLQDAHDTWKARSEWHEKAYADTLKKEQEWRSKYHTISSRVHLVAIAIGLLVGGVVGVFTFTKLGFALSFSGYGWIVPIGVGLVSGLAVMGAVQLFFRVSS